MSLRDRFKDIDRSVAQMEREFYLHSKAPGGGGFGPAAAVASQDQASSIFESSSQSRYMRAYKAASSGHPFTAIRPLAIKVADSEFKVGRKSAKIANAMMLKSMLYQHRNAPLEIRKAIESEGLDVLTEHPLLDILDRPNPYMSQWALLYCTAFSIDAVGEALWWLDFGPEGNRIWYWPRSWARPIPSGTDSFAFWKITIPGIPDGSIPNVPGKDMVHFRMPDPADPTGSHSATFAQSRAINTDDQIQESQLAGMKNSIRPTLGVVIGDVLPVPGGGQMRPELTPDQRTAIMSAIRLAYRGAMHNGDPMIMDALISDLKQIFPSPAELDWQNSSQLTKDRIFQGFATNPIVAGQIEGANRASSFVAHAGFYDLKVNPILKLISQEVTVKLAPRFSAVNEILRCWFPLVRATDEDLVLEQITMLAANNWIEPNEAREHFNLPPNDKIQARWEKQQEEASKQSSLQSDQMAAGVESAKHGIEKSKQDMELAQQQAKQEAKANAQAAATQKPPPTGLGKKPSPAQKPKREVAGNRLKPPSRPAGPKPLVPRQKSLGGQSQLLPSDETGHDPLDGPRTEKFNPHHAADGKFASASGTKVGKPGKASSVGKGPAQHPDGSGGNAKSGGIDLNSDEFRRDAAAHIKSESKKNAGKHLKTYREFESRTKEKTDAIRQKVAALEKDPDYKFVKQAQAKFDKSESAWVKMSQRKKELVELSRKNLITSSQRKELAGIEKKSAAMLDEFGKLHTEKVAAESRLREKVMSAIRPKVSNPVITKETVEHLNGTTTSQYPYGRPVTSQGTQKSVREAADFLGAINGGQKIHVQVSEIAITHGGRPHCQGNEVLLGRNTATKVVVHEMGHAIEHSDPRVKAITNGFLYSRVGKEDAVQLKTIRPENGYDPREFGRKDKFQKAFGAAEYYVGKHYSHGTTEILSMGLEKLYADPVGFAKRDPGYFRMVVGVMHGA